MKGSNNTRGIQKHCQRENENYQNKDIDSEKTHLNYDLVNHENIDFNQKINGRIEAGYHGKRKMRSDAIRHIDGIITSDSEFFANKSQAEKDKFFKDSLNFLENEYGKDNMLYASVHYDEKTPHMHFGFVPLTDDGRLSAKEKLGNKKNLSQLQDKFNFEMSIGEGYDLKRGASKSGKKHKTVEEYKSETQYHEKETELAKEECERVKAEQKTVEKELEKMKAQLKKEVDRFNEPLDIFLENEVETERNLFGKVTSSERTGRLIMTDEDFTTIKHKYFSATRILDDYERLRDTDFYKENQDLKKENDSLKTENRELSDINGALEESKSEVIALKAKNQELKDFSNTMIQSVTGLYRAGRRHIKGFEGAYDRFVDVLAEKERTEPLSRFMKDIQGVVHEEDREKSRRHDLEL